MRRKLLDLSFINRELAVKATCFCADIQNSMKRTLTIFIALKLLFLMGTGVFAQSVPNEQFIDSADIRLQIRDEWLAGEIDPVSCLLATAYTDRYVNTFSVSQKKEVATKLLAITVTPKEQAGIQGTWILYRKLIDGMSDHIRIYPSNNAALFISLRPDGNNPEKGKSLLDMSLYGALVCHDIPIGVPFIRLYTAPLSLIVSMTQKTVPWHLLTPDVSRYRDIESAVSVVRSQLPSLVYFEDGAFNEKGEPVLIKDGSPQDPKALWSVITQEKKAATVIGGVNCSGFAKWIVDGIIRPRAGQGLYINPLKKETPSPETHFTGPYRNSRDLFFALDWTRNLASAVVSLELKKTIQSDASGVDVVVEPFALSTGYEKNVGYRCEMLIPLMYYLAATESGNFYLGAISRERGDPLLRQYHHIAAFFPYFDPEGNLIVAVFESAVETPKETFVKNNTGAFINLVRVRIPETGYFNP